MESRTNPSLLNVSVLILVTFGNMRFVKSFGTTVDPSLNSNSQTFENTTFQNDSFINATSSLCAENATGINPCNYSASNNDPLQWNLLERVRVYDTQRFSYNWTSKFDDRDPRFVFTIILSMQWHERYTGALSFQASGSPITSAMEDFFKHESHLSDYCFE